MGQDTIEMKGRSWQMLFLEFKAKKLVLLFIVKIPC